MNPKYGKRAAILALAWLWAGFLLPQEPQHSIKTVLAQAQVLPEQDKSGSGFDIGPPIPLPTKGTPQQLWSSAAADDAGRLLVCTVEEDSRHARLSSVAYVSLDAGNTWMSTLLDDDSDWVSETACEAGTQGRDYFVAGASNTTQGAMRHSWGSAEMYRSSDGGLTWTTPRRYPFIDWMKLAVFASGPKETVFLFGNIQAAGNGDAGGGTWSEERRPMLVSTDGLNYSAPAFPEHSSAANSGQGFPLGAVAVNEATVLVLFAEISQGGFDLYRSDANGYRRVSKIEMPSGVEEYGSLSAQMAFARGGQHSGRLYVIIPALEGNLPVLVLAATDDQGKTWQSHILLRNDTVISKDEITYFYAGIAVNSSGVVGIEWFTGGGCPLFAISEDGGSSIKESRRLGSCVGNNTLDEVPPGVADNYVKAYSDRSQLMHPLRYSPSAPPGFTIHAAAAALGSAQIAADAAGRFHAFWLEPRTDGLMTFTATVTLRSGINEQLQLAQLPELTSRALVHLQEQSFDSSTGIFNLDLTVRNSSSSSIAYPSFLEVIADRSDCGTIRYLNAAARSELGHSVFRVPQPSDRKHLLPGQDSLPVHIEVLAQGCQADHISFLQSARRAAMKGLSFFPLVVRFHVYGKKACAIASGCAS